MLGTRGSSDLVHCSGKKASDCKLGQGTLWYADWQMPSIAFRSLRWEVIEGICHQMLSQDSLVPSVGILTLVNMSLMLALTGWSEGCALRLTGTTTRLMQSWGSQYISS